MKGWEHHREAAVLESRYAHHRMAEGASRSRSDPHHPPDPLNPHSRERLMRVGRSAARMVAGAVMETGLGKQGTRDWDGDRTSTG